MIVNARFGAAYAQRKSLPVWRSGRDFLYRKREGYPTKRLRIEYNRRDVSPQASRGDKISRDR